VMAAHLAFFNKKRGRSKSICYDGRGAFKAELEEYNVIPVAELIKSAGRLEAEAVNNSDYRIAVSEELVKYWEKEFDYLRGKEVVIPCTISTGLDETVNNDITLEEVMTMRRKLGWGQYDIVLIYSGSGAGWQSFDLLKKIFRHFLAADSRFKALFMSQEDQVITKLQEEFPGQVQRVWVAHEEVRSYLKSGDYGIMIREDSVTNRVSSPTKFAEYLSCGLRVLCSDSIGDYTNFVRKEECGVVVNESNYEGVVLVPITTGERNRIKKIGYHRFSKLSSEVMEKYGTLIEGLL
jgi:glycosyltransferase involved in cell wall biosynthesis